MENKKITAPNGITFGMVSVVAMSITIVLILTLTKIYLANQIYYESKIVNKMVREVSVLKAENIMLKRNVETLKFKDSVTNTIFSIQGN